MRRGEAQGGSEARGINFAEVVDMPRFQQGKTVFAAVSEQRAEDASCGRGGSTRQLDADECWPRCSVDRPRPLKLRGLNIQWPFSRLILGEVKKVEVRRYPLGYRNPNVLAGEMAWLIETKGTSEAPANAIVDSVCVGDRPGQARIVGIIAFSGSECYADMKAFREDARSHCVKKGGDKDWDGVGERYAWRIASVKMLQAPILAPRKTQTGMPWATTFDVVVC